MHVDVLYAQTVCCFAIGLVVGAAWHPTRSDQPAVRASRAPHALSTLDNRTFLVAVSRRTDSQASVVVFQPTDRWLATLLGEHPTPPAPADQTIPVISDPLFATIRADQASGVTSFADLFVVANARVMNRTVKPEHTEPHYYIATVTWRELAWNAKPVASNSLVRTWTRTVDPAYAASLCKQEHAGAIDAAAKIAIDPQAASCVPQALL
jgi:hypothetical protein